MKVSSFYLKNSCNMHREICLAANSAALDTLSRKELQQLAKENGVKANLKSEDIISELQSVLKPGAAPVTASLAVTSTSSKKDKIAIAVAPSKKVKEAKLDKKFDKKSDVGFDAEPMSDAMSEQVG